MSVNDVLIKLIRLGHVNRAAKVAQNYKVSDVTFTWIQLRALVSQRDWNSLEKWIAKLKKSPIGFEPFVTEILAAGNRRLAIAVVPRCIDVSSRIDLYLKLEEPLKAAQEAFKQKDMIRLKRIKDVAGSSAGDVETLIRQLKDNKR